ncbi:MAG: hypothetical protein ACMG55_16965 [Microcoleus sp.]
MKNIDTSVIERSFIDHPFTYPEAVDPTILASDVIDSFQKSADGDGYRAMSKNYQYSNSAYNIAAIAKDRVPGESLELPENYDSAALRALALKTSYPGRETFISTQQAEDLAQIGSGLLELNKAGKIKPPLGIIETQSITHLVQVVKHVGEMALRS